MDKIQELENRVIALEKRLSKIAAEEIIEEAVEIKVGDSVVLTKPLTGISANIVEQDKVFYSDSAGRLSGTDVGTFELDLPEAFTQEAMSVNNIEGDFVEITDAKTFAWSPVLRENVTVSTILIPKEFIEKV